MIPENKKRGLEEEDDNTFDITHNEEQASWLENAVGKIDTEFPLSGGEREEDFENIGEDDDDFTSHEHLDDNFPLSGG